MKEFNNGVIRDVQWKETPGMAYAWAGGKLFVRMNQAQLEEARAGGKCVCVDLNTGDLYLAPRFRDPFADVILASCEEMARECECYLEPDGVFIFTVMNPFSSGGGS